MKAEPLPVFLIIVLSCASLLLLSSSVVNVASSPDTPRPKAQPRDIEFQAYSTAKQLALQQHPDLKDISGFTQSPVQRSNDIFTVVLACAGFDPRLGPVRVFCAVQMQWTGDSWRLIEIRR